MMNKFLCLILGHKWDYRPPNDILKGAKGPIVLYKVKCSRCGK